MAPRAISGSLPLRTVASATARKCHQRVFGLLKSGFGKPRHRSLATPLLAYPHPGQ